VVNAVSKKHSQEELMERAYYRIAWNIHHMWSETGHSDTRLFQEPLIPDKFVVVGKSTKGTDRKEHVVPRRELCVECHRMFEEGASIEEVSFVISKYLKIVLISKEEQDYLDHQLKLKQTMPAGWSFKDGNPFQRLEHANIEYELFP
jgi:hypothetical protein